MIYAIACDMSLKRRDIFCSAKCFGSATLLYASRIVGVLRSRRGRIYASRDITIKRLIAKPDLSGLREGDRYSISLSLWCSIKREIIEIHKLVQRSGGEFPTRSVVESSDSIVIN